MQSELLSGLNNSVTVGNNSDANRAIELFQKMRTHCNFLEDFDSLGDMNNTQRLRELI